MGPGLDSGRLCESVGDDPLSGWIFVVPRNLTQEKGYIRASWSSSIPFRAPFTPTSTFLSSSFSYKRNSNQYSFSINLLSLIILHERASSTPRVTVL